MVTGAGSTVYGSKLLSPTLLVDYSSLFHTKEKVGGLSGGDLRGNYCIIILNVMGASDIHVFLYHSLSSFSFCVLVTLTVFYFSRVPQ